jgi:flagellar biosynthetic protein FlhB
VPEDQAQKTEPATPRRREEARRRGEVAQSREVQSVAVLGAAMLGLGSFLGSDLAVRLAEHAQAAWSGALQAPGSLMGFHAAFLQAAAAAAGLVPFLLLLAFAGAGSQILQTGPLLATEALRFRGSRLSPARGLRRMFSADRIYELGKSLLKVAVVGGVGYAVIASELQLVTSLAGAGLGDSLAATGRLARRLATGILAALAAMAAVDLFYQRWRWEQRMRMSKREVRDELRQREGDPLVRSRFRAKHRQLSRLRMIAAVAEADVVVANPTRYAAALRYDRTAMAAPRVVAKGRNQVALRIRQAAVDNRVPIVEDPPLARLLYQSTAVGHEIPQNLFKAVAEVLAFVFRLDPTRGSAWGAYS